MGYLIKSSDGVTLSREDEADALALVRKLGSEGWVGGVARAYAEDGSLEITVRRDPGGVVETDWRTGQERRL